MNTVTIQDVKQEAGV